MTCVPVRKGKFIYEHTGKAPHEKEERVLCVGHGGSQKPPEAGGEEIDRPPSEPPGGASTQHLDLRPAASAP